MGHHIPSLRVILAVFDKFVAAFEQGVVIERLCNAIGIDIGDRQQRPSGGVAAVARRALCNSDGHGRLIEVGPCPACKGVTFKGGVVEGDVGAINGVGGWVGGGHAAACQVVGDVVGEGDERSGDRHVLGGHGEGVAAHGAGGGAVVGRVPVGQVIIVESDGGGGGVVGDLVIGHAFSSGGNADLFGQCEGVDAAGTVDVITVCKIANTYVGGIGLVAICKCAVEVVVAGEGSVARVSRVSTDDTYIIRIRIVSNIAIHYKAVFNAAIISVTHKGSDVQISSNAYSIKDKVFNTSTIDKTEKANIFLPTLVNGDITYGLAIAVEGAVEKRITAYSVKCHAAHVDVVA